MWDPEGGWVRLGAGCLAPKRLFPQRGGEQRGEDALTAIEKLKETTSVGFLGGVLERG